jgi:hypothetical protein
VRYTKNQLQKCIEAARKLRDEIQAGAFEGKLFGTGSLYACNGTDGMTCLGGEMVKRAGVPCSLYDLPGDHVLYKANDDANGDPKAGSEALTKWIYLAEPFLLDPDLL